MKKYLWAAMVLIAVFKTQASTEQGGTKNHRMLNRFGITTGFGSPFPSILGMNGSYNLTEFMRLSVGTGSLEISSGESSASVKTLGLGTDLLLPDWNFSPLVGLHLSNVDVSNSGDAELSVQGIEKDTTILHIKAGLDWQAAGGFSIGFGGVVGLTGEKASGSYLNMGWFF